jgi:hypothetical protein
MRIFKFALSFTLHHWGEEIRKRQEMHDAHVENMKTLHRSLVSNPEGNEITFSKDSWKNDILRKLGCVRA